jgi:uncharacterized membrane protein
MANRSIRLNLLPIGITLMLFVGAVLILAGIVVLFAGNPWQGGARYPLYDYLMTGGAVMIGLGAWISGWWYKRQKPTGD